MRPARKRLLAQYVRDVYGTSMRRACDLAQINRATAYYRSCRKSRVELRMRLRNLAEARAGYGYRRLHVLLCREGWSVNHKLVWRLYKEEGLECCLRSRWARKMLYPSPKR